MNALNDSCAGRVYLLDAHGLIFQMYHGLPPMNAPDGRPTNAVFGVTRALMSLYDLGAEHLIAAFDLAGPTFRNAIDADYKAHRPPPPDDLIVQEPMIRQVFEAMRVPILTHEGFEADDILATLALDASARGCDVFLCTSDKDCRQLLGPRVKIMNLRKNEILDTDGLMNDWGIRPDQVADFQALVGDSVDNVPGVPGCGPKTATKWLKQYGTLDNIIAHADELSGPKLKQAFKDAVASGKLDASRKLVRLRTDVPVAIDWNLWKRRDWDGPRLLALFQEFGFRSFAERVRSTLTAIGALRNAAMLETIGTTTNPGAEAPRSINSPPPTGGSLFDAIYETENPFADAPKDNWSYSGYKLVDTDAKFRSFLTILKQQKRFCFDLETTSLDTHVAEIVGIAFCWSPGEAYYLPFRGPAESATLSVTALDALKPIFEDASVAKVNQNIKYDWLVLKARGINLAGISGDPMIAHYLLHATERSHGLDDLTRNYLHHANISIDSLIGKGKKQLPMDAVPVEKVKDYAAEDADTAWRLAAILEPQLAEQGLNALYDDLELPLIPVLGDMEHTGIRIDSEFLARLSREMADQLDAVEKTIHDLAGRTFNIASPLQLRKVLFEEMKLPIQKRTGKTGEPSTDQETLENLAALGHAIPKAIIEHRQIAKLKGTYVDALPTLVHPKTGRVHTSFNQTIASTGRLSSSDPNLQNIPARTEQGRQIRQAFIPRDGWTLLTADYSQIELRLLAHFCGDDALRRAFAEDRDVHALVAADIFKVPESDVTGAQRRVAKTVNFGVIYGMSSHGLATRLGISRQEANEFIDAYFHRFRRVLDYQDAVLTRARTEGFVRTILGRRRPFDPAAIRPNSTYHQRNQAEREAINMEIQGSAADLMKKAMIHVARRLQSDRLEAKLLLTVHDELVFETPPEELKIVANLVREEMTGAMSLSVPLKVDVAAGPNWLDVSDV